MREVELRLAAAAFAADGDCCPITPIGRGNINDTYLVASLSRPFVLQRINPDVFPEPLRVIENFALVSSHLRKEGAKLSRAFLCAEPVPTLSGRLWHCDARGGYWRSQSFLRHRAVAAVETPRQGRELGRVLAIIHLLLRGLDTRRLAEPLPGFHHLPSYLANYDALAALEKETDRETEACHLAVVRSRERSLELERARDAGILTVRPIHGDPKIDNVLFDENGYACGFLDLDTVMMGLLHYDLGDCLRSSCNRGGEESGFGSPRFDLDICRAVLAGYRETAAETLSERDASYIFAGVFGITFELGLRFFTDHLRGDRYFKVGCRGDNLRRASTQFSLAEEILAKEDDIRRIVAASQG